LGLEDLFRFCSSHDTKFSEALWEDKVRPSLF
jgi:hypothetical protein